MAVQIAFVFQSPDRTDYLNQRLAGLIGKGIYSGAELTPTGSGLTATRAPFFALGRDGITIWDSEVGTFTYTSGVENYHVLLAKYNPLGTPSTPVVQELILSASEYNTHVDKPYLIVIGKITPAGGVLLNSEIDYSLRDEVGPFGRVQLRGVVDNTGDLPTGDPNWNRSGDLYVCRDDPAPGGGGLYLYEDGTGWRLVAAKGAATLDGAYDNNGAGGPPGYGRWIAVDSQAVELLQDTTSQRQNDVGNAALRIRKTGTTIAGDVGIDTVFAYANRDVAANLVRANFVAAPYMEADEPVNVSGNTLTCTRGSANWNHSSIHKIPLLVELTNSAISNDGLFIALPNGATTCVIRSLDATTPTLSTETGTTLTANFFCIRQATGAANVARLTEYESGSEFVAATEYYGNQAGSGTGKVVYYTPGTLNYVWKYKLTQGGASGHTIAYMTDGGSWVFRPLAGSEDWHTLDGQHSNGSFAVVKAHHTANGHAVRATSVSGVAVYADSDNHNGGEFRGGLHALYAQTSNSAWNYASVRAQCTDGSPAVYATVNQTYAAVIGSSTGIGGKGGWFELNNAGDTTGYGIYCKHAGSGTAIFSETLGASNGIAVFGKTAGASSDIFSAGYALGVRGEASGADAIGVMGEHLLGSYAGWGVLGWNNNSDVNKGAIDGFAWGGGPGVMGGSVFGIGVYGNSSILSVEPGVEGLGQGFGTGVKGTSAFGIGVEGSSFGYTQKVEVAYQVPPTEMMPEDYSSWEYGALAGGFTLEPGWFRTGSGTKFLWWLWTDFEDGIRVKGVTARFSHGSGALVDIVLIRRHYTWEWDAVAQAREYKTESWSYVLQATSQVISGTGTTELTYGTGSTPAVVPHTLYQPARLDPTNTSDLLGSALMLSYSCDSTNVILKDLVLTCECRGASKWVAPDTV